MTRPQTPDDETGGIAVRRTTVFAAPRARVWDALTRPEQLDQWLGADVDWQPVAGGTGTFRCHDGRVRQAVVERADDGRRLTFSWWDPDATDEPASTVDLRLDEAAGGTRLTVVERPVGGATTASAEASTRWGEGWNARLGALRGHVDALVLA